MTLPGFTPCALCDGPIAPGDELWTDRDEPVCAGCGGVLESIETGDWPAEDQRLGMPPRTPVDFDEAGGWRALPCPPDQEDAP